MQEEIQLFIAHPGALELAPPDIRWLEQLDSRERRIYRRFTHARRGHEWLTGRWLAAQALKSVLGRVETQALRTGRQGELIYTPAPLHLSLSHSHGITAVALGSEPLGLDVECLRSRSLVAHAGQVFTPAEARGLGQASGRPGLVRFYRLWTLKEAFCKAAGVPLETALHGAEFDLQTGVCTTSFKAAAGPWQFLSAELATDWALALATCGAHATLPRTARHWQGGQWRHAALSEVTFLHSTRRYTVTQSNGICAETSSV